MNSPLTVLFVLKAAVPIRFWAWTGGKGLGSVMARFLCGFQVSWVALRSKYSPLELLYNDLQKAGLVRRQSVLAYKCSSDAQENEEGTERRVWILENEEKVVDKERGVCCCAISCFIYFRKYSMLFACILPRQIYKLSTEVIIFLAIVLLPYLSACYQHYFSFFNWLLCFASYIMNIQFSKQVDKVNQLLNSTREEPSIALETANHSHTCTPRRKPSSNVSSPGSRPKYESQILLVKQEIPKRYLKILEGLFKAKCESLKIKVNQRNWQEFIKAFLSKNQMDQDGISNQILNLNDFNLGETCLRQINTILQDNSALTVIKLNKNLLNPNNLVRIATFKQLTLCNCKLGNNALEELFVRLQDSAIQKICLSSPEVKNRNQLTRYEHLIALIQKSSTLHTLQLSNMDIQPDCMILESCRNTSLRHIDLSDNTNVKGIASTLLSLNLSRNSIVIPFTYPMLPNDLNSLNFSYNKIPIYQLKQFLKLTYFNNLRQIIFDHLKLDGELSSMQYFLEQSLTLAKLSLVDCDLSQMGFHNIAHGVKHCKTLEWLDLSYNKMHNEKTAESLAHMIQGGVLKELKMRHCQIKDNLGAVLFKNIRKTKTLQKMDLMNNLLGDCTAKAICSQLKLAKTILNLCLQENIIKYKDIHEINSYLQGNRYFNVYQLDKEYNKLLQINNQIQEANLIINAENQKLAKLEKETEDLEGQYIVKFKVDNLEKKSKLRQKIYALRDEENMLMTDITIIQSLPSLTELNSMQSGRQSFIEHSTFTNL